MGDTERNSKWLRQQNFYHGFIPREDLLYILKRQGDYIIRTTDRPTAKGRQRDLVLSLAWPEGNGALVSNDVRNIVIKKNQKGFFCLDKMDKFETLESLLDFYHTYPIKMKACDGKARLIRPIPLLPWEYRNNQVSLQKKVGQGAYGEVYKGKVKRGKNGKTFEAAIKTMKGDINANDEKMKEVMGEARLMRSLNHPNIVRIRGIAVMEQPYYIIIDFINGGGLDSYLRKKKNKITIEEKNKMAISAAWGIDFIHAQNIIHRDIAARNCLYDSKNYVKLSDFGLSRKGPEYKMKTARRMPTRWLAPESLRTFTFYRASDVFTYGLLLYEIYTVREPYDDLTGAEARKRTMSGDYPNFEKEAPNQLYSIVTRMVYIPEHEKRATMTQVVKALEEWLQVELVFHEQDDFDKTNLQDDDGPAAPVQEESLVPPSIPVDKTDALDQLLNKTQSGTPVEDDPVTTVTTTITKITEERVTTPVDTDKNVPPAISPADDRLKSSSVKDYSPRKTNPSEDRNKIRSTVDEEKRAGDGESGMFEKIRLKKKSSVDSDIKTAKKCTDSDKSNLEKLEIKKVDEEKITIRISDGEKSTFQVKKVIVEETNPIVKITDSEQSVFERPKGKKKSALDQLKEAARQCDGEISMFVRSKSKSKRNTSKANDDIRTATKTSNSDTSVFERPDSKNKNKGAASTSDGEKSVFANGGLEKNAVQKDKIPSEEEEKTARIMFVVDDKPPNDKKKSDTEVAIPLAKTPEDEEVTAKCLEDGGNALKVEKPHARKKTRKGDSKKKTKNSNGEEKTAKVMEDGESGMFEKNRSKRKKGQDDIKVTRVSDEEKKVSRITADGESGMFEKPRAKKNIGSPDEKPPRTSDREKGGIFEKTDSKNNLFRRSDKKRKKH